jgi:hypothetical protein
MIRRLVDDFRAGRPPTASSKDAYADFALHKAVGTRPTLMPYTLPLDDAWMRHVSRQVTEDRRPGPEWVRGKAIEPRDDDDVWVSREDLRPLDDACTKFVTQKFLPDAFARVNLVANVIRLYDRLAQVSQLPFRIVFKGGVMQRLVLLEFWHDMPGRVRAVEYLAKHKAVSISDMDFEVVTDGKEKGKHRLLALHYATLLWLQARLAEEIRSGTSGMLQVEWDREAGAAELKAHLQAAVDGLDKTHPMHGARVDRVVIGGHVPDPPKGYATRNGKVAPAPRRNLFLFACGDGNETPCVAPAADVFADMGVSGVPCAVPPRSPLYATCNTYLNEGAVRQRPDELRPLFHLARIKHAFVLYYTAKDGTRRCDRLAGELVDLSQGDPKDENAADLHARLGARGGYRAYPILGVGDVALRGYTVAHVLLEHEQILHRSSVPPWEVPKYEKRLCRYAAFLLVHVLSPDVPGSWDAKLAALRKLVAYMSQPLDAPLRTGCAPVDAFAARERRSLAPARNAQAYRKALHAHLKALVGFCGEPRGTRLSIYSSHLQDVRRHARIDGCPVMYSHSS